MKRPDYELYYLSCFRPQVAGLTNISSKIRSPPPLLRNSPQSRRKTMAGMLNFTPAPLFRPVPTRRARNDRVFMVKSSANTSETPLSSISPPPNFKAPQPKPFAVRPDRVLDILGASLALLFRLTTSVLVSGYLISYSTFISIYCCRYMFLCIISCSLFVLILHLIFVSNKIERKRFGMKL